jgi:transposase-like protein
LPITSKSERIITHIELNEYLGYERYAPEGINSGNSRNGKSNKSLKNDDGEMELTVPRARNGEIRAVIYAANAVEAVHRQFKKVIKNRYLFPNADNLKAGVCKIF